MFAVRFPQLVHACVICCYFPNAFALCLKGDAISYRSPAVKNCEEVHISKRKLTFLMRPEIYTLMMWVLTYKSTMTPGTISQQRAIRKCTAFQWRRPIQKCRYSNKNTGVKFVFAAGHLMVQQCQKIVVSKPVLTCSGLERAEDPWVNSCAKKFWPTFRLKLKTLHEFGLLWGLQNYHH